VSSAQDQVRVDEQLARGDLAGIERDFRLIEDGPPTVSLFVVQNRKMRIYGNATGRFRMILLWGRRNRKAIRGFKRAFYERVVQVYAQRR